MDLQTNVRDIQMDQVLAQLIKDVARLELKVESLENLLKSMLTRETPNNQVAPNVVQAERRTIHDLEARLREATELNKVKDNRIADLEKDVK